MRKFGVLFWAWLFIALTVNGQDELGYAMSSREVVEQQLKRMDVEIGYGAGCGRMVAVETRGFSLKGDDEADDELTFIEKYDFPDDEADDFETKRFKAVWKAYADGLAQIAQSIAVTTPQADKTKVNKLGAASNYISNDISMAMEQNLEGVVTITTAESCNDKEYEFSVAVCQTERRKRLNEAYRQGRRAETPGRYSLKEWIDNKSGTGIICPQSYCDNEGVWWRVAGVPVDLSAGRNSKKVALKTEKARRYAYEAAMRTIAVRVSASTSISVLHKSNDGDKRKEKMERDVKIDPINTILPVDPSQVRWFELDRMNPMTGKPVRCVVAALRSGNSKNTTAESSKMREQLKRLARDLDIDKTKVDLITQQRMHGLKYKLSEIDVQLKYEQSMPPEIRKRIEEQLLEISREVIELKGGKGNEDHQ